MEISEPLETSISERCLTENQLVVTTMPRSRGSKKNSILRINPDFVDLRPEPIPAAWVLDGTPQARVTKLVNSHDWTCTVIGWECTPGSFKWHYSKDETIFFLSGEAFMTDGKKEEHRFGAGDIAFFAAGTSCVWRVTEQIRKVAVVRETIWSPLGFVLKASKKLLRGEYS